MAVEPFALHIDAPRRLVRFTMTGAWEVITGDSMLAAFAQVSESLGKEPWYLLVDARKSSLQTEPVQQAIVRCMQLNVSNNMARCARLIDASLVKLQLGRLALQTNHNRRDFTDESEALRWLLAK